MRQNRVVLMGGAFMVAVLVVVYVLVPTAKGQPLVMAAAFGGAGLLAVLAALGASLPARTRSALGWGLFAVAPVALLLWVFTVGIPPGVGAVAMGFVLCGMAVAGLVLAVRGITV